MIDQRDSQGGALGLGVTGCVSRGGSQSQHFDEATAADLTPIELVEFRCDETFHDGPPANYFHGFSSSELASCTGELNGSSTFTLPLRETKDRPVARKAAFTRLSSKLGIVEQT